MKYQQKRALIQMGKNMYSQMLPFVLFLALISTIAATDKASAKKTVSKKPLAMKMISRHS